jgi:hypothetical protein
MFIRIINKERSNNLLHYRSPTWYILHKGNEYLAWNNYRGQIVHCDGYEKSCDVFHHEHLQIPPQVIEEYITFYGSWYGLKLHIIHYKNKRYFYPILIWIVAASGILIPVGLRLFN